jgi:glycosyltransferase involved in cell wall biosynthesis
MSSPAEALAPVTHPTVERPGGSHALLDPRIPIVLYIDASWAAGGLVTYVVDFATGLRRRGYRVATICHGNDVLARMRSQLRAAGVEIHEVETFSRSFVGRMRRVLDFASVVRRYRDCVLVLEMGYYLHGGLVTLAGALGRAGAIVRVEHMRPKPEDLTWRGSFLYRLKDRLVDGLVVVSAENRDAFAAHVDVRRQMAVIPAAVDLEKLQPARADRDGTRRSFGYAADDVVIGHISLLTEHRKGVSYFLQMAARIARAHPNARFLIVGDGPFRAPWERLAGTLGIADRVTFAGQRYDVPDLLAAMDLFVMPSLFEGGPITVLEAMAMGKPVVSTRVGVVPEVMDDGETGLIVPPADADALTEAVQALLQDAGMRARLGGAARAEAVRRFSIDAMVDSYLDVMARAWAAKHTGRRR